VLQRRVRHVVTEIARVEQAAALLLAPGGQSPGGQSPGGHAPGGQQARLDRLGPLLDASHASLRDDYQVSSPELDLVCEAAVEAGAVGARMTGGGFGGSAIALIETGTGDDVAAAVRAAATRRGLRAPAFLRALPGAGASRVA
jgi:galactokinase